MIPLLDIAPDAGVIGKTAGIGAAAVFLLVVGAGAFIAYKLLKRSVKMAFRVAIVAVILVIGVAGSVALWALERKPSGTPVRHSTK